MEAVAQAYREELTWKDKPKGLGILGVSSPENYFSGESSSHRQVSEKTFRTYRQLYGRHTQEGGLMSTFTLPSRGGASGGKSGRPSLSLCEGDRLTRETKMGLKRDQTTIADYRYADRYFHKYVTTPFVVPICDSAGGNTGLLTKDELQHLHQLAPLLFKRELRPHTAFDTSTIHDLPEEGGSTGQLRRLLDSSKLSRQKGNLSNPDGPNRDRLSNMLVVPNDFFSHAKFRDFDFLSVIKRVGNDLAKLLREGGLRMHVKAAAGYPKRCHETEMFETPPLARPQGGHQDSRFNIAVIAIDLTVACAAISANCAMPKLSTFVARPGTNLDFKCTEKIEYMQLQLPEFLPLCGLGFHGAWPHKGAGNLLSKKAPRYAAFFSFALDEVAERHTTDEVVYYESEIRNPSVVYGT